ncbi:MAG: hypothetical protein WC708_07175 [Lentisphaeria bacterium]
MKKLILTLVCAGCAMGEVMAAYQYGDNVEYRGQNQLYTTSSAALSIDILNPLSRNLTLSNWDYLIVNATDANGNLTLRNVAIAGDSIDIGSFEAGTKLQFQLSNERFTTTRGRLAGMGWDPSAGEHDYLVFDGNYGIWGTDQYVDVAFRVGVGTPIPSGQPLPGVALALLIGGGAFGAAGFGKARRKTAAG